MILTAMGDVPIYNSVKKELKIDPVSLKSGHTSRMAKILNGTRSKIVVDGKIVVKENS